MRHGLALPCLSAVVGSCALPWCWALKSGIDAPLEAGREGPAEARATLEGLEAHEGEGHANAQLSRKEREAKKADRNAQRKAEREAGKADAERKAAEASEMPRAHESDELEKAGATVERLRGELAKAEATFQRLAEAERLQWLMAHRVQEHSNAGATLERLEAREVATTTLADARGGRPGDLGSSAPDAGMEAATTTTLAASRGVRLSDLGSSASDAGWRRAPDAPGGARPRWWEDDSNSRLLRVPAAWRDGAAKTWRDKPEKQVTAIVTHAGKNSQDFIDSAVMLAVSLRRHLPEYPRFAIAVRGMTEENQETLEKAGWTVLLVDDWSEFQQSEDQLQSSATSGAAPTVPSDDQLQSNATTRAAPTVLLQEASKLMSQRRYDVEYDAGEGYQHKYDAEYDLGEGYSYEEEGMPKDNFFWRWADAFEKLNIFRLPFGRVLYLDADTYVMSHKLDVLLKSTTLADGNIGMVKDGCSDMYNSGVMLFKPHRGTFVKMLRIAGGVMSGVLKERHDQPIINEVYKGRVTEIEKMYNCLDRTGRTAAAECAQSCKEVVVAHFTGLPKPATADQKFLDIVRRPYSPILHCFNTNHGSCGVWSKYYCDLSENKASLTRKLRHSVGATGSCCHTPRRADDSPECRDGCPSQVTVDGWASRAELFNKTNLPSDPILNAGRPVFVGPETFFIGNSEVVRTYLFYLKPYGNWVIGKDYRATTGWQYSHQRGSCPSDTKQWKDAMSREDCNTSVSVTPGSPITADMVLDLASGSGEWIN